MAVLAIALALILGAGLTGVAQASSEDVAMFYDDLSQHGEWAEYENYGPVWRPSQVPENWRPYSDGRWVPTDNGYVFETQEPWGWATYHYGNWMPTQGHGWVWVPGRTWYPSTVEWRTSPENTPPDESYIGWAPIPPPNYVPPPDYAQPSYSPGNPLVDALTAPFWIFAKAASFLLGLGQPYAPAYSYANAGVLVPMSYVPVFYPQTVIVRSYYSPAYYPPAYFGGRRLGFAAYNWGPPPAYIHRVTRINQVTFNRAVYNNSRHITRIHNVVPPGAVINRHGYLKQIMPPALAQGRALPRPNRVENYRLAQANLYKPNVLAAPRQVPPIKAQFHKLQPVAGFQPRPAVQPVPQAGPGRVAPGAPVTPGVHPQPGQAQRGQVQPGRAVPGEFRPGPPRAVEPRATQPRQGPGSPGYRPPAVEPRAQQERDQQRRQQEALRQRQQPREPQVRPPQLQQQQQQQMRQRQQEQDLQRRRQQEVQRQQIRERQLQQQRIHQPQYQRPQPQIRPQVQPQPAPRPRPQVQPQPRPQPRPQPQVQQRPAPRPQPQVQSQPQPQRPQQQPQQKSEPRRRHPQEQQ